MVCIPHQLLEIYISVIVISMRMQFAALYIMVYSKHSEGNNHSYYVYYTARVIKTSVFRTFSSQ